MSSGRAMKDGASYLPEAGLERLITILREEGYTVLGPRAIEGVIALRPLSTAADLPRGVKDEQEGGFYRLRDGDPALSFQCAVGQDSPKLCFFPAVLPLFRLRAGEEGFTLTPQKPSPPRLALLGIRPCDLAAIGVQDRTFMETDRYYREARQAALLIPVNCTSPGNTCFCASMGTGPAASEGFDLALTELHGGFLAQAGSAQGEALLAKLPARAPNDAERELAQIKLQLAAARMGRRLDTKGLPEALAAAIEHPRWDVVARRCLGCGNCTLVCPTCFCSTVSDSTSWNGEEAIRTRRWESCYTHQFTAAVTGPERVTIRARYRHWLRHKLSTWRMQFGVSGCVGCGRCITWCPVGIDLTEEAAAIRRQPCS